MKFVELNLHPDLQKALDEAGYIDCTGVQTQVLQNAFKGTDLYVQSQTGTGKTAAYLITIFQRLLCEQELTGRKALIMVPTRELAVQVEEEAKKIGKYLPFKVGSFYGGVGYAQQTKILRENAQVLVGTPGRVLDLNASGQMPLMDLAFLILDEADRMFDMGFYPDLRKLIKVVPPVDRRQTMLFSATLNAYIKGLAWEYTKEPLEIEIEPEHIAVVEIDQLLYHVPSEDKMKLLLGIFEREQPDSAIIFCNTKRYTEIIAKRLNMNGIPADFIIGDLPQEKRLKVIEDIKSGKSRVLVGTDVAARGLDVEGLSLVVNYDLPNESENYVHRIGRTGRAGKTGRAISFASEQDVYGLPAIEKYLGKKIPSEVAAEELYASDKTQGLRIHSEVYGDSRFGDSRYGDNRSGDNRGNRDDRGNRDGQTGRRDGRGSRDEALHGRRPEDSRRNERGPRTAPTAERARTDEKRSVPATRRSAEASPRAEAAKPRTDRNAARARPAPRESQAAKPDLSKVSLEERMAYYRKKYGGNDAAAVSPASRGGNRGTSTQGARKAPQGKQGMQSQKAPKKSSLFGKIASLFGKK